MLLRSEALTHSNKLMPVEAAISYVVFAVWKGKNI